MRHFLRLLFWTICLFLVLDVFTEVVGRSHDINYAGRWVCSLEDSCQRNHDGDVLAYEGGSLVWVSDKEWRHNAFCRDVIDSLEAELGECRGD